MQPSRLGAIAGNRCHLWARGRESPKKAKFPKFHWEYR